MLLPPHKRNFNQRDPPDQGVLKTTFVYAWDQGMLVKGRRENITQAPIQAVSPELWAVDFLLWSETTSLEFNY